MVCLCAVWRWLALPSQKDFVSLALSNTACEMLRVLKDHLHQMQTLLSKSLFNDFWQHLATRLNDYILREVNLVILLINDLAKKINWKEISEGSLDT